MRAAFPIKDKYMKEIGLKENLKKKVELLAPAGNKEAFYGAIHAGADAVYLGGDKFGARAYADNFTTEELVECIRYAHIWGRKVYLTVNTLVKDKEWDQLYDYIRPFYEAGLDGVIIQDLGVFLYLKEHFPGMELHVSTQMTLTGSHGAAWMKELGACRIVPARELSLEEIKTIKRDTGLEIEAFIHGAMCYCYSGQCLFSSILGGRSGNRGRCAQPCRLPYTVGDGKRKKKQESDESYPLSLKDMCTIEHIPELIEAGIDSFKIEGRMKKPEYAAGVTAIYRKVIDRYYKNPQKFHVSASELKDLSGLYIRSERQDGYYHKHNGADMITLKSPAYSGNDEELLKRVRHDYLEQKPRRKIDIYGEFHVGSHALITLVCDTQSVSVCGDAVQPAQKQPVTLENVEKQLTKLGETPFAAENVFIQIDEQAFYPLKALNELRRKAVNALENSMIESYGLCFKRVTAPDGSRIECSRADSAIVDSAIASAENFVKAAVNKSYTMASGKTGNLTITVRTPEQLKAVAEFTDQHSQSKEIRRLYVEGDLLITSKQELIGLLTNLSEHTEIFLVLPYILREADNRYMDRLLKLLTEERIFVGCMVRSLEGYAYLLYNHYAGKISSDAGFYIWNQETLKFWCDKLDSFCLPWELNAGEQKALLSSLPEENAGAPEKIVYGYIPMMVTANCVYKTTGRCPKQTGNSGLTQLSDRYQKKFPVAANCMHCMNVIYNSVPLSLHATLDKWRSLASYRLDFTVEDYKMCLAVLEYFYKAINGEDGDLPYTEYTTGHEKRGVE